MPVYEYVCKPCDVKFERYVRAWNEPVQCPACASGEVEKQLSTFAFSSSSGFVGSAPSQGGACCGGACGCRHS
jgi:putative FmdB family regulatory protein